MREHSNYPFRSARLGEYLTLTFVNNRIAQKLRRGTYRILMHIDQTVNTWSSGALVAVGKGGIDKYFPAGCTMTSGVGEFLPCSGYHLSGVNQIHCNPLCAVEIDIQDDDMEFYAYSLQGVERIRVVRVGDLPSQDRQLEGQP